LNEREGNRKVLYPEREGRERSDEKGRRGMGIREGKNVTPPRGKKDYVKKGKKLMSRMLREEKKSKTLF